MILFFTRSMEHLKEKINLPVAQYEIKQFSDGEIYVKINQPIENKKIWVITQTGAPANNLLELFFLLNALVRNSAQHINILFTYFGYARQSEPTLNEAASAQVICDILKMFPIGKIYTIHIHHPAIMQKLLSFTDVIDMNFFSHLAKDFDVIAAPDKGASHFAQKIAQDTNKQIVFLHKIRPQQEKVIIKSIDGETVQGKKILLVDDIVSTGNTLINATQTLKNLGAERVSAAITHGIFSGDSLTKLSASSLEKIYVTNTLKQQATNHIVVYDIAGYIESTLKQQ